MALEHTWAVEQTKAVYYTERAVETLPFFVSEASGVAAPEAKEKNKLSLRGGSGYINASKINNLAYIKPFFLSTFKNWCSRNHHPDSVST